MRHIARGLALSVVGLMAFVPIQAAPAAAAGESLNVEPEKVLRITDSIQRLTATVTPAAAENIVFDEDDNPVTAPLGSCTTDAVTGACSIKFTRAAGVKLTIRAYVSDGVSPTSLPCGPVDPPDANADADCTEGQDEVASPGLRSEAPTPDDTDVVEIEFQPGTLDVEPESQALAPGATVNLTATVKSTETTPRNLVANVDGEILGGTPPSPNANKVTTGADLDCNTDPTSGACTLTYTAGSGSGVDTIQAWVDENSDPELPTDPESDGNETGGADFEADPDEGVDEIADPGATEKDRTDVVKVDLSSGPVLNLTPPSATKAIGANSGLTATYTAGGVTQSGARIAAAVLTGGANAGKTATCITTAGGTCTLDYVGTVAGIDKVRATVDTDANGQPNEADSSEDVGVPGGTIEPDTTAVSQITWTAPTPPPGGGGIAGAKNQCDSTRSTAGKKEILIGTKGNDKLCGYGGNDTLRGLAGNDRLNGGKGKDTAAGGKGKDRCKAEREKKSCEK